MKNDSFNDDKAYIVPSHFRSLLGKIIWNTFAADELAGWRDGKIVRPYTLGNQLPYLPNLDSYDNLNVGDWVENLIKTLDEALPDVNDLIEALDYDSLTIRANSPAFIIPDSPSTIDAAECLISSRILIKCIDEVIPPMFSTNEDLLIPLNIISRLAIILGGEEAFLHAITIVMDPDTYKVTEIDDEALKFNEDETN